MGNNHSSKFRKSACISEQLQIESEDHSDSFELKSIPNNKLFIFPSLCEDNLSEPGSNQNSSDQALKFCMEHPNGISELSRIIDKEELILKNEFREAILFNITNNKNEISEIHFESDCLYL